MRLNPQINSIRNRVLFVKGLFMLFRCAMLLPALEIKKGRGRKPYDYRIVLVLSILRTIFKKRYEDYEAEMRFDPRIQKILRLKNLPCKSTVNNYDLQIFTIDLLVKLNRMLIKNWVKKPLDLALDASGIQLVGRSVWFNIRTKKKIRKKDCDKVHIATSLCSLLITDFAISNSRKNDSPFLRKLLQGYNNLGLILADKGYSNKTNALFVSKKGGAFFAPFKSNAVASGLNTWAYMKKLWTTFQFACKNIYARRNVVECVFSALKRRYGDKLHCRKWYSRRREMAMRFIAYNVRIIIAIQIAHEKQIPLWVRA
jgi:hypothetical protein